MVGGVRLGMRALTIGIVVGIGVWGLNVLEWFIVGIVRFISFF